MQTGAHEMRKFECDGLVVARTHGGFELHAQLVELDGQEFDGHVAVERLGVGPALHAVLVGQAFVDRKERIQLVVVDMPVLKRTASTTS